MWEPVRHTAISRVGQMGTRTACRHLSCCSKFAWNLSIPALCSSVQARSASGSPLVCDHQDFIPSEMASRHLLCLTGSAWNASSPTLCASFQMLNATGSPFVCDRHCFIPSEMVCRHLSCWSKFAWNCPSPPCVAQSKHVALRGFSWCAPTTLSCSLSSSRK
jgi:hypothetical protein